MVAVLVALLVLLVHEVSLQRRRQVRGGGRIRVRRDQLAQAGRGDARVGTVTRREAAAEAQGAVANVDPVRHDLEIGSDRNSFRSFGRDVGSLLRRRQEVGRLGGGDCRRRERPIAGVDFVQADERVSLPGDRVGDRRGAVVEERAAGRDKHRPAVAARRGAVGDQDRGRLEDRAVEGRLPVDLALGVGAAVYVEGIQGGVVDAARRDIEHGHGAALDVRAGRVGLGVGVAVAVQNVARELDEAHGGRGVQERPQRRKLVHRGWFTDRVVRREVRVIGGGEGPNACWRVGRSADGAVQVDGPDAARLVLIGPRRGPHAVRGRLQAGVRGEVDARPPGRLGLVRVGEDDGRAADVAEGGPGLLVAARMSAPPGRVVGVRERPVGRVGAAGLRALADVVVGRAGGRARRVRVGLAVVAGRPEQPVQGVKAPDVRVRLHLMRRADEDRGHIAVGARHAPGSDPGLSDYGVYGGCGLDSGERSVIGRVGFRPAQGEPPHRLRRRHEGVGRVVLRVRRAIRQGRIMTGGPPDVEAAVELLPGRLEGGQRGPARRDAEGVQRIQDAVAVADVDDGV